MNGTVTTTTTTDEGDREQQRPAPAPLGVGGREQRRERRRAELRRRGERDQRPARGRRAQRQQRPDPERRDQGVVGVRVHRVERPRAGEPGEPERPAERPALVAGAQPPAERDQADDAGEVEADRRRVRGADAGVPDAVPGPDELEREVGEVVDRPVDVALEVEPEREGAFVERLAVGDPVGADDPGDADVDHPRVDEVERDPGSRQHRRPRSPASAPAPGDQRPGALARPEPRDQHPDQEIAEHRVGERDRGGDLGAVEEEQRDPEPEQHQQVEVQQSQRPARIEERRTEQQAERDPDPGRVDLLGDRALVAAGERRADLEVPPRLDRPGPRCRRRSPPRPWRRRRTYSTCQRSPRIRARGSAPGLSASSAWTTPVASAAPIASSAETSNPGGGRVCDSGSTSFGGSSPPNGDCSAGSSAAAGAGASRARPQSAGTSAASDPRKRCRRLISARATVRGQGAPRRCGAESAALIRTPARNRERARQSTHRCRDRHRDRRADRGPAARPRPTTVTLFEADRRIGGHTNTVRVDDPRGERWIDTGFIVHNDRNYPALHGAARRARGRDPGGARWGCRSPRPTAGSSSRTPGAGCSRSARTCCGPGFWRLIRDQLRFNREVRPLAGRARRADGRRVPARLRLLALVLRARDRSPRSRRSGPPTPRRSGTSRSASSPSSSTTTASCSSPGRPQWRTIPGGSRVYVERLLERFGGRVRAGAPVRAIERLGGGVGVIAGDGRGEAFDQVVIAAHSDQALAMLAGADRGGARGARGAALPAQRGGPAHRRLADAAAPARLGELELPPRRRAGGRGPRSPTG